MWSVLYTIPSISECREVNILQSDLHLHTLGTRKEIDSDTTSVESQNERSAGTYLEAEEGKFL